MSLYCDAGSIGLGKPYSFEKTVEIPPRPEMDCADRVRGVRAGTDGMGAIHFASIGVYKPSDLEYRPVTDEGAGDGAEATADDAAATETAWIPMTAAVTPVVPGTYEVRIAATDHSFASYSKQVVVEERDPSSLKHPLVLDANGGSWVQADKMPVEYDTTETLVLPTGSDITRDGYTFSGWYESDDFSGSSVAQIDPGEVEPITLYARWSPNTYAVKLNLSGGAFASAADDVTSYVTGTGAALAAPSRAGYTFGGWFDNEACTGSQVSSIGVFDFGDKELWAKWNPLTYTVALELMGGELVEGLSDTPTYQTGTSIVLPTADDITRLGYAFAGWFDNADYAGSPVTVITEADFGDKQFWAKWTTILYEVSLEKNQGTLKVGEQDVFSYQYGFGVTLPELERGGYTFEGWYASDDFSGDPVGAIGADEMGDKQFWAKWTPITYTVVYNMGSDHKGDVPPDTIDLSAYESYTAGTALALPTADTVAWEGHTFAGWYDDAEFANSPMTEISAGSYGDITLYARWAGDACVLAFHGNGGAFATAPQTIYEFGEGGAQEGSTVALPSAADITRGGYTFEGWYDNADFNGQPLESVELRRGNIDLFAKWTAVEYGIAYELNGGAWASGYAAPSSYTVDGGEVLLPGSADVVRDGFTFKGWYDNAALSGTAVSRVSAGETGDKAFYASWQAGEVTDPDNPDGPDNPDNPGGSDDSALKIISLVIGSMVDSPVVWDETGYARIELPRDKMPTKKEDFSIVVPQGVVVQSIAKRERLIVQRLAALLGAADNESDIWDIMLQSADEPTLQKRYTLEVVPLDGDSPDNPPVTPPDGDGDTPGGDDNPGGDDRPGGNTPGGNNPGNNNPGGSNGGGASGDGSNGGSGGGSKLAATGDNPTSLATLLAMVSLFSALLAAAAFRRSKLEG